VCALSGTDFWDRDLASHVGLLAVQRAEAAGGVGTDVEPSVYRAAVPTQRAAGVPACDNCAAPDDATSPVRRVYLDLAPGDTSTEATRHVVPEVERWCAACRATYPHEPA
jgi:hypothetical protein